jgi:biotin transport system substrate-specific component
MLMSSKTASLTIVDRMWPIESQQGRLLRTVCLALFGTLLLTLSAKVKVPFYPVPMTMQTMVVLMISASCGLRMGAAVVLGYLLEGALGLPVFADTPERGVGLAYMMGPTGGYLFGFLIAAVVTGAMADRGMARSLPSLLALMLVGHALMFVSGYAYLGLLIGYDKAWLLGVLPFLPSTAVKIALGTVLQKGADLWSRLS